MKQEPDNKCWGTIQVPAKEFQARMSELANQNDETIDPDKTASVYSRLALVHQIAKVYAFDQVKSDKTLNPTIEIEELTDPPLSEQEAEDELVIIRFSYLA